MDFAGFLRESSDYWPLLPRGPYLEVPAPDAFVQRVAEREGVDR